MQCRVSIQDKQIKVGLSEELTFDDHDAFREVLKTISSAGAISCVLDLRDLASIDSAGLGMLMIAHETAAKEGCALALHQPKGQVQRMLEVTEFGKIIEIVS